MLQGFPGGLVVKNLPANAGDMSSIPSLRRSHKLELVSGKAHAPQWTVALAFQTKESPHTEKRRPGAAKIIFLSKWVNLLKQRVFQQFYINENGYLLSYFLYICLFSFHIYDSLDIILYKQEFSFDLYLHHIWIRSNGEDRHLTVYTASIQYILFQEYTEYL